MRDVWEDYYTKADAIIYMVDLFDQERIEESRDEFWSMLKQDVMKGCVVLVLGNKIDRPKIMDVEQLKTYFNIEEAGDFVKSISFFPISLYTGKGKSKNFTKLR